MGEFDNLHQILLSLYDEMMPLCADMTGVAKGLAGLFTRYSFRSTTR